MRTALSWPAIVFAAILMATPALADHDRDYYDDDDDDVSFGLHIGPDSFGLYLDKEEYDRYGGRSRFGLRFDEFGGGIFFEGDDYGDRRYRRGHWYCPRGYCDRGGRRWGRGLGRGRARGYGRYDCHPVFKRGYRRGREVLIRGRMCYDRDGYAYIVPGSRRVVRRY